MSDRQSNDNAALLGGEAGEGARAPAAMPGDWIEVDATHEGTPRRGIILETLGTGKHTHFRVRWEEQHESLFYPAERGYIVHPRRTAAGRRPERRA